MTNEETQPLEGGRKEGEGQVLPPPPPPLREAARSLEALNRPSSTEAGLTALMADLERSLESGADCTGMLYTQARVLDALFKRIVMRDIHSNYKFEDGVPRLKDDQINFALRAQKQCRATIEALEKNRANELKGGEKPK